MIIFIQPDIYIDFAFKFPYYKSSTTSKKIKTPFKILSQPRLLIYILIILLSWVV